MQTLSPRSEELERLRASVDLAPVGIAHFDESGHFEFVNQQLCDLFLFSRDELLERTFQAISFPEDLPHCMELNRQLAAGEIPRYTHEKRFKRRDGSWIYTRVIVTAVRDSSDRILFFLGIVEDLSDQWADAEGKRAAEERLALSLDASGTGIYRYDFRREGLDWSNNLGAMFGIDESEELSLQRLLACIHPEDLPRVLDAYAHSATGGADFDEEFRIVRPNGEIRWICDRARMTLDAAGRSWYLTGACIDITAQRNAEQARHEMFDRERAARAEAERATRLRDELLAVVAHDLRSPLHTIMMGAGAMSDGGLTSAEHDAELQVIKRAARRMDHLIGDLLDVSQIEMGRLAVHPQRTDIRSIIDEAAAAHTQAASERQLVITAEVEDDLPAVRADHARISQALNNLLSNAIKFTERPGRIRACARHVGEQVEIAVIDEGPGIRAEDLPHVFERYWQAERSRHGVGLGLAIVRGIVEAHGGSVHVSSTVGIGSTFSFTLPVDR